MQRIVNPLPILSDELQFVDAALLLTVDQSQVAEPHDDKLKFVGRRNLPKYAGV
jgi:hypothetical protein